jgi:D-inositol-3-phosphate glycosyltransferase
LKAPDLLLRAAAQLRSEPEYADDLQVVVVGAASGSVAEPGWLAHVARSLDLDDTVRFVPPAGRSVVADYYRAADLTVVPSYNESFGLVALESQACGTPVVAAAVGGLSTAVADGVSGVLVDGHDPAQWAKVIDHLLRSPVAVDALSARARTHAANFSWDRTTASLVETYEEAIEQLARQAS